jgi:alkylhydroperoxidase/carboxymuconolactone decarboxylase family protein YurZ
MTKGTPHVNASDAQVSNAHVRAIGLLEERDRMRSDAWRDALSRAQTSPELEGRIDGLIVVTMNAIVHRPPVEASSDLSAAFDAGANITEIIEMLIRAALLEGGIHSIHDGMESLSRVVSARESAGLPVPLRGEGLTEQDVLPEHDDHPGHWTRVVYPYQVNTTYLEFWAKYHPELHDAYYRLIQERFALRKELRKRTEELVVTAIDSLISWPEPLLDSHIHLAFDAGATAQELVEAILVVGRFDDGLRGMQSGFDALRRVIDEREAQGDPAPRTREG